MTRGPVEAAGGVVWRQGADGKPELLVVHRPRYDDWSLPKGKLDSGESHRACAEREVREETGYGVEVGPAIGAVAYTTETGELKRVRYWLMRSIEGSFRPNEEVDQIRWTAPSGGRALLDYAMDRAVFDRGLQLIDHRHSGRIILVRNARVAEHEPGNGRKHQRPLSRQGEQQAGDLISIISRVPINDVLSSPWTRCVSTVAPLARRLGLDVERRSVLAPGTSVAHLRELVASLGSRTAVVCTHRRVIETLLRDLAGDAVPLDGPGGAKRASTWVLETREARVVGGRYLPAPG